MPLVGVNNCQPILHMSKRMVHCYSKDEIINKCAIGYMINPSLNCNKVFREQVEKSLSVSFHKNTMETIKYRLMKKNTCVIILIMIYEYNGQETKQKYKVLGCVVYSLIDNYIGIDYILCQSKP